MNDRMAAKFFGARNDLWWGEMLAERDGPGDSEAARELLARSAAAAISNGYAGIERQASAALQDLD